MPILRGQVSIPATSTVSEDTVTNTWHFSATDSTEGTLAEIKAGLVSFYEGWDAYKSDLQNWSGARIKFYDLADEEPRVPVSDTGLTLTSASSSSSLPHECAICVSFAGDYVSGASQARRRGRIYCGPLNNASFFDSSGLVTTVAMTAFASAGGALLLASTTASDWAWVVYSPTSGQSYPVTGGWVDNAIDIQRRRGFKASQRSTF